MWQKPAHPSSLAFWGGRAQKQDTNLKTQLSSLRKSIDQLSKAIPKVQKRLSPATEVAQTGAHCFASLNPPPLSVCCRTRQSRSTSGPRQDPRCRKRRPLPPSKRCLQRRERACKSSRGSSSNTAQGFLSSLYAHGARMQGRDAPR
jgi:hypothetical protein